MRQAPPLVVGTLEERPVASLLIYTLDTGFEGSIVFAQTGERHVLYFENGRPCQADSPLATNAMSRVLLDLGLVEPAALLEALTCQPDGEPLCWFLVDRGELSIGALATARMQQLERKVRSLITLTPDTRFAMFPDENHVASDSAMSACDPLPIIVDAIRERPNDYPLVDTLQRFGHAVISINPHAPVRELGFGPELAIVRALSEEPRSLRELVDDEVAAPSVTLIALYALAVTRCLHFGTELPTPLAKCRHTSTRRHDSYPPPRTSGFFEHRPRRSRPRADVKPARAHGAR